MEHPLGKQIFKGKANKIVFAITLIYLVGLAYNFGSIMQSLEVLETGSLHLLLVLVALALLSFLVRGIKFFVITSPILKQDVVSSLAKVYWPPMFFSILPAKAPDLFRLKLLYDAGVPSVTQSVTIIVIDRVFDVIGLTLLSIFCFGWFVISTQQYQILELLIYGSVGLVGVFLFVMLFLRKAVFEKLGNLRWLKPVVDTLKTLTLRKFIKLLSLTVIGWIPEIFGFYIAILVITGDEVLLTLALGAYSLATIFGGFSPLPAGAATFEGTLLGLMYNSIDFATLIGVVLFHRVCVISTALALGAITFTGLQIERFNFLK